MKLLNGRELADFIKERQAHQVRGLIQHDKVKPKLAIVTTSRADHENLPIETYMRMKQKYADDILIDTEIFRAPQDDLLEIVEKINNDPEIHGVIIQLPLENINQTDEIVNAVAPEKDVDALGQNAILDPATPMAINWLLAGYNVDLTQKHIAIVGNGRLVGKPLARMWRNSGLDVEVMDRKTENLHEKLLSSDVIVTATGVPNLITSDDVKFGAVVVDAGTAAEHGKIVGDVSEELRARDDIKITPQIGGVGPLTISALMDNVIRTARATIKSNN
ncbi:MAG: bifunctional 5,10-methylenetetrahydrofolate dehydrogenase/5,10-methenyltetrahydrofolate cyclohydrolase [Candidatus Nomurabacteria bacterium]|jgi:methylenetetrahydrofolate dehydrogenase (NADP+)/methenyltetrahydrofolate cyclohydrolase|nr:bifunctional 5,10-methylenetetrahydrofolate dehydrogenase/5,10-methenyltetrahydrofolate cyclohydrolase [Candidatus Nomurabacteria bacterium]